MTRFRFVLGLMAVVGILIYAAVGDFDLDTPDADQQEKTATACLAAAGLHVKSDIPPYSRLGSPEYELDVDAEGDEHDHLAYVFLFDDSDAAETYFEREKSDAEDDPPPEGLKIEQRGPDVLRIFSDDPEAAKIRACVDKAAKPPPKKK